jgi:ADP-heptose:LPS heptosyltransferase
MEPQKILLVQLYSNGDCLYATTVARQIKKDYPGAHLTWAIASFCKNIIANNPYVDAVMEVNTVAKNDVAAFRRFKKEICRQQKRGIYDEVFIVHNADTNHAYYDGSIRSSILKAYPNPITVPIQPVLRLLPGEVEKANKFALDNDLESYRNVVLFEYAPQSGQSNITVDFAIRVAEGIVADNNTAIILSSANKVTHPNPAIIDGSSLTLRETAALSHHCNFLLGSSSGITWVTTSEAGKTLPMVQLLNANTTWVNPISRDFERFHIPNDQVIELLDFDEAKIVECVCIALNDFRKAKQQFNQPIPLHFKTTRKIVYNLLVYFEFGAIARHIKVNREVYGDRLDFYKELMMGFLVAPFTLIKNIFQKRIKKAVK